MAFDVKPGARSFDGFHDYWNQLLLARRAIERPEPGECLVPRRQDFDPMKVHRQLPHVYITEWRADHEMEVRLSGTALDDTAGRALTGSNYFDTVGPKEMPFFSGVIKAVVKQPCGMKMRRTVTLKDGSAYQLRSLSFPLADREGAVRYIVGMMNVIRDIPMSTFEEAAHARSEVHDVTFIDIGAGVPDKPQLPAAG